MKTVKKEAGSIGVVWKRLSSCLDLPYTGTEQDWDLEMADSSRLAQFLCFYEAEQLSEIERKELMRLILASTNDAIEKGNVEGSELSRISELISDEYCLHRSTIRYWSCAGETAAENLFPLSSFARQLMTRFESASEVE